MSRRNWSRDELIVAFNLYCKLPFGQLHSRNPQIVDVAKFLGRSPAAVAMKLVNFAALDPTHHQRGVTGLKNTSKADRQVWDEFNADWSSLAVESERILQGLAETSIAQIPPEESAFVQITEREQIARVRLGQAFFRMAVLASYGHRCCICQVPEQTLLVASHIVPWAARTDLRVNPRNGLCLCALHDRAFDRGLITLERSFLVRISKKLIEHLPDKVIEGMFVEFQDRPIRLPEKFSPEVEYLDFHREQIFLAG